MEIVRVHIHGRIQDSTHSTYYETGLVNLLFCTKPRRYDTVRTLQ